MIRKLNLKIKFTLVIFAFVTLELILSEQSEQSSDINNPKPKHPGDGKPFGESGPFVQLDETSDLSTKDFFENYVKPKKALLIKNMAKEFPAFSRWSNDNYLREISRPYDDFKLLVETQKKESRDQDIISLSLNEFLDQYEEKEIYIVDQVPNFMKKDLVLPQQLQCGQAPKTLEETVRIVLNKNQLNNLLFIGYFFVRCFGFHQAVQNQ